LSQEVTDLLRVLPCNLAVLSLLEPPVPSTLSGLAKYAGDDGCCS
jgi:hypothetical protein